MLTDSVEMRPKGVKSDKVKVAKADKPKAAKKEKPVKTAPKAKAAPKAEKPAAEKKAPAKKASAKKEAKASGDYDRHIPYFENIKEKYDAKADEAVVMAITKYLGASLE